MSRTALKSKKKKLRNGPIIEIHPQILRWKAARNTQCKKELQLKQLIETSESFKEVAPMPLSVDPWELFK